MCQGVHRIFLPVRLVLGLPLFTDGKAKKGEVKFCVQGHLAKKPRQGRDLNPQCWAL